MKYPILTIIVLFLCVLELAAGCADLAKIGHMIQTTGDAGQKAGNVIPVYGTIITAVSTLLSIGGGIMYRVASKRGTALETVISAISEVSEAGTISHVKEAARSISIKKGISNYLDKWVQAIDPHITTAKEG